MITENIILRRNNLLCYRLRAQKKDGTLLPLTNPTRIVLEGIGGSTFELDSDTDASSFQWTTQDYIVTLNLNIVVSEDLKGSHSIRIITFHTEYTDGIPWEGLIFNMIE